MTTLNRANRELYGQGRDEAFAAHNDLHDQCRQERQNHASNDIANKGGFLDRLISRECLKPRYGAGWRSL